jgi:voltage-gated potassium channel
MKTKATLPPLQRIILDPSSVTSPIRYRILSVLSLFVLLHLLGTVGFMLLERLGFAEAFYLNAMTLSTVGFGDIVPRTLHGKIFATLIVFSGLFLSGISVGLIGQSIYEGVLINLIEGRRMNKAIQDFKDHFIVCGRGTTGDRIVKELLHRGHQVVAIDCEPETRTDQVAMVFGDARRDKTLLDAGLARAKGLAAVLTNDADNVFIVLTARHLNPNLKIVSRFKDPDSERKLKIAGADFVISPYEIGGHRLALSLFNPFLVDFLDHSLTQSDLGVHFAHIHVPPHSPIRQYDLKASGIRENSLGALIVALTQKGGTTLFNPPPNTSLAQVEELLLLGTSEQEASLKAYLDKAPLVKGSPTSPIK